MSEDQAQEKTEQATPKRKLDSRKKGQLPRSKDLNNFMMMIVASGGLLVFVPRISEALLSVMKDSFVFNRAVIFDPTFLALATIKLAKLVLIALLPYFGLLALAAILSPVLLGGWNFSFDSLMPKASKLSFFKGIKRMFSVKAIMELLKALGKFLVISSSSLLILWFLIDDFLAIGQQSGVIAIKEAVYLLGFSFIAISSTLIIIALIDVPFQIYEHTKNLKMTKQEVRDEMKDVEGKPEVKQNIRRVQQELANSRMIEKVPEADVIITNPTHYTVAVKYDKDKSSAPFVIAKGVDHLAFRIRDVGLKHNVPILSIPPLARSIYHTTKRNHEIPTGLYTVVAQVLAYVYQLKKMNISDNQDLKQFNNLEIPEDLKY